MNDDDTNSTREPTRRDYVKYGGALVGGGLLTGCLGDESTTDVTDTAERTTTDTETSPSKSTTDASSDTPTADGSYSVTLSPMGEVQFDGVPETAYAYSPHYADMAVAYGHGDTIASLGSPESYVPSLNYYYDTIDGVSFDIDDVEQVWNDGVDKELFYDIDADIHFQDPCWLRTFGSNWTETDIDEIRQNIGPWFGNRYSREYTQPPEGCREGYRYYTLWELSEKVASVFRERERFAALHDEYEALHTTIRTNLPPKSERPTVGLVAFRDDVFRPYEVNNQGFAKAHVRPLGARDAFADSDRTYDENYGSSYDYEGLLGVDPDVILHSQGISGFFDVAAIRETWEDHPVGSELTAVQNDRVYSSGTPFQGPLMNLFQLEMTAKQVYPEVFGEWPGDGSEDSYPDLSPGEQLFDHQRVADVINGEI